VCWNSVVFDWSLLLSVYRRREELILSAFNGKEERGGTVNVEGLLENVSVQPEGFL
jgi:hypothetical protein